MKLLFCPKLFKSLIQNHNLFSVILFPIVLISLWATYAISSFILIYMRDEIYQLSTTLKTTPEIQKFISEFFPDERSLEISNLGRRKNNHSVLVLTHLSERSNTKKMSHHFIFATTLFGSWKLNVKKQRRRRSLASVLVDLLVYCPTFMCRKLPFECSKLEREDFFLTGKHFDSQCFYREYMESEHRYSYINTFAYLQDPDLRTIINNYDYILKTDPDTFLTPSFFTWRPTSPILIGYGAYSHRFNFAMLQTLSDELGLKRQNLWNVGPSWYVKTKYFIQLSKMALYLTMFVYYDEFSERRKEKTGHHFQKRPDWYRDASHMYGSDLAVQSYTGALDLSESEVRSYGGIDFNSISKEQLMRVKHIHLNSHWNRIFSKYHFNYDVSTYCDSKGSVSNRIEPFFKSIQMPESVTETTSVRDYCQSVAIKSFLDYVLEHGCNENNPTQL